MLGSRVRGGMPGSQQMLGLPTEQAYHHPDALGGGDSVSGGETDSCPPMYNPRTSWASETAPVAHERKHAADAPSPGGSGASAQQQQQLQQQQQGYPFSPGYPQSPLATTGNPRELGPRSTQDLVDLEEENRVLRREVARLQQLNEARRKQLTDMQSRLDDVEWTSHQRGHPPHGSSYQPGRGESPTKAGSLQHSSSGGNALAQVPARQVSASPGRGGGADSAADGQSSREGAPHSSTSAALLQARVGRLTGLVERWKQKAFSWEERYSALWSEIAKCDHALRGPTAEAILHALRTVAPPGRIGLLEQVELEETNETLRRDLDKLKAQLDHKRDPPTRSSSPAWSAAKPAQDRTPGKTEPTPPSPAREPCSPERLTAAASPVSLAGATAVPPGACHQCMDYRYRLAELTNRVATDEDKRLADGQSAKQFPFCQLLPGMESLAESLRQALKGRDAAMGLAKLMSDYVDEYLQLVSAPVLPTVREPDLFLYAGDYDDDDMGPD
ncbi:hypothetical protein DIPPA_00861 [Diplonema papillatum]|nr:hypothetical protein DIPPA_00861 [Diplonema papillatum]